MPKNDDLDRIKTEISLLSLAEKAGIQLKRLGSGEYAGRCPFHEDRTPSLHINAEKNIFHCKGCEASGSPIDWIVHERKVSAGEAIRFLKGLLPTLAEPKNGSANAKAENNPAPIFSAQAQKLLHMVVGFYHNTLKENSRAVKYLMKRGITQGELVDEFKIGYCEGNLLEKLGMNDQAMLETLRQTGILHNNQEHFRNCLVFPVINNEGVITEIYGRCLDKSRGLKHLYLPGPHHGMFNPKSLLHHEVFICEAIIDALSLMSLGYRQVTAAFGVSGFTPEMLDLFSQNEVEKVYVCYDVDRPGLRAAEKLADSLRELGISSYRIQFPTKDANEFICKRTQPALEFKELIANAQPLFEVKADTAIPSLAQTPTTQDAAAPQVVPKEHWQQVGNEYHFNFGSRTYIIRGLAENKANTAMKVFIKVQKAAATGSGLDFHIDNNLDLFNAKTTGSFVRAAAGNLDLDWHIIKADLDKITSTLDDLLNKLLKEKEKPAEKIEFRIDLAMQQEALRYLKEPLSFKLFVENVENCGLVGEPLAASFCFLATLSRYLAEQLHVIIQAESSAGKSTMLNLTSSFVPEEDAHYFTQISPKSFYHTEEDALMQKSVAICESDGMEAALYPVKQMMSENRLSLASTITDPKTGEHVSKMKQKDVKSQFMITSPKEGLDEEIENRCVIITLDESPEQTRRIQEIQRLLRSPEGVHIRNERKRFISFYQHVQREIEPLVVVNSYAKYLDFSSDNHRARRDHQKYLMVIECITLFFQHQREIITSPNGDRLVKTHLVDIAIAHFMIRRLFKTTLDELAPQTRNFLRHLIKFMTEEAEKKNIDILNLWIYRRDMREITRLSNTRVHEHAQRLTLYEYMTTRRDENGLAYRLRFRPDENGDISTSLQLVSISFLKKRAGKKERAEYAAFLPYLKQIFKALDANYQEGEV